jgi:hypothetical protein
VLPLEVIVALGLGDLRGRRVSPCFFGTQTRPSFLSDSLISVSFDWCSPLTGMHVGWICVKQGFANTRRACGPATRQ